MEYHNFLNSKEFKYESSGFDVNIEEINPNLFEFQKHIVKWALKKGKAALFLDTGLGKTICQLEFANQIIKKFGGKILIIAPLAVSMQTKKEGEKFQIHVNICRRQSDVIDGINITNYEMIDHFDSHQFIGVILDESSIIKNFMGKITSSIIDKFRETPYKLCCTATPSPNDHQELGTHSEFLNIMKRSEMLANFFINDAKEGQWRMKRHAENKFWQWVSEWAMVLKNPDDLGFDGSKYQLPPLNIKTIFVESGVKIGELIPQPAKTLTERRDARKESIDLKIVEIQRLINGMDNCLIWVDYNYESSAVSKLPGIVEVKGSDSLEHKEKSLMGFANGDIKFMVSKPSITGFGMNYQNCNNMIFMGLSDSYERFYQAIRRSWRFGQMNPVNVYVLLNEREISILNNIKRKEKQHEEMTNNMVKYTNEILKKEIYNTTRITDIYNPLQNINIPKWLKEEK